MWIEPTSGCIRGALTSARHSSWLFILLLVSNTKKLLSNEKLFASTGIPSVESSFLLLRFVRLKKTYLKQNVRRWSSSVGCWQWIWYVQGWIRRRWRPSCRLPLHCRPSSPPGIKNSSQTSNNKSEIVQLIIFSEHSKRNPLGFKNISWSKGGKKD